MKRTRTYDVRFESLNSWTICYREGGRAWEVKDNRGHTLRFTTEQEARDHVGTLPFPQETA